MVARRGPGRSAPRRGATPLLELRGLGKRYGAMLGARRRRTSWREPAKSTPCVGANGAGKSTLLHLLAGIIRRAPARSASTARTVPSPRPRDARACRHRLGPPGARRPARAHRRRERLARPRAADARRAARPARRCAPRTVELLSVRAAARSRRRRASAQRRRPAARGDRARPVRFARILTLDEPSAVLSMQRARSSVRHRARAKGQGTAGAVRVASARRGLRDRRPGDGAAQRRRVFEGATAQVTRNELVRHMVGHDGRRAQARRARFRRRQTITSASRGTEPPVSTQAGRTGEILGLGGLVGAAGHASRAGSPGSSAESRPATGCEAQVHVRSARRRSRHGIVYLTEDRKRDGLFLNLSVASNASAAALGRTRSGCFSRRASMRRSRRCSSDWRSSPRRCATGAALSGGNQQKVLFGRALCGAAARARLRRADARRRRRRARGDLRAHRIARRSGVAIVVVCSDLKELLGLAHRILVVREARVVAELPPNAQEHDIVEASVPSAAPTLQRASEE